MSGSLGVANFELYLRTLSEFLDSDLFRVAALDFCEDVEVGVEVLRIVLVGVGTKFVVVDASVLPLLVRFDIKQAHKRV